MRRKPEMSRRKQLQNFEILRELKIEKTKMKKMQFIFAHDIKVYKRKISNFALYI